MNTLKVIYLLSLLRSASQGKEEVLTRLYENAMRDNPEYRELSSLLADMEFYREMGNALRYEGKALTEAALKNPDGDLDTIRDMRKIRDRIKLGALESARLFEMPGAFMEPVTVVEQSLKAGYMRFLECVAAVCVYLLAVYVGAVSLENLHWVEGGGGLQERLHAVNSVFLPALCGEYPIPKAWMITRKAAGGGNQFGGSFYSLSYFSDSNLKVLTSSYQAEQPTPLFFLNRQAVETGELNVPYCWGIGNLVSTVPEDALRLLHSGLVIKPSSPTKHDLSAPPPTPLECLHRLCGGSPFCISVEDLVNVLNKWQMGYDVMCIRQRGGCLLCARPVLNGGLVCPTHFA